MALRNGISLGRRKKHIRIGDKYHWVEGVRCREKLSRRDYLDYLKNKAKSRDMAVLELTFRKGSVGKWSKKIFLSFFLN